MLGSPDAKGGWLQPFGNRPTGHEAAASRIPIILLLTKKIERSDYPVDFQARHYAPLLLGIGFHTNLPAIRRLAKPASSACSHAYPSEITNIFRLAVSLVCSIGVHLANVSSSD